MSDEVEEGVVFDPAYMEADPEAANLPEDETEEDEDA